MGKKVRTRQQIKDDILTQTKVCTRCGNRKTFDEFSVYTKTVDGRSSVCMECNSSGSPRKRRWSRHNRTLEQIQYDISSKSKVCNRCGIRQPFEVFSEVALSRSPDSRHSTCRGCRSAGRNEWRLNNKERHDYNQRSHLYGKKFGITVEDYEVIYKLQGGICACCGRPSEDNVRFGKIERLSVDHDHADGNVRGLLCHQCNTGIGLLGDTVEGVKKALTYLGGELSA